jgi:hypothetical protein
MNSKVRATKAILHSEERKRGIPSKIMKEGHNYQKNRKSIEITRKQHATLNGVPSGEGRPKPHQGKSDGPGKRLTDLAVE